MDPTKKISQSRQMGYINEHFGKMKKCVDHMEEAINEDFAMKFVDEFIGLQWQERSIIHACRALMVELDFSEEDLMAKQLDEYKE